MRRLAAAVLIAAAILVPREARGYSLLAHQSNIDTLWDAQIRPLLLGKYPRTSPARSSTRAPTPTGDRSSSTWGTTRSAARDRFGTALLAVARGEVQLPNVNLDTGKPSAPGEYALADETTRELAKRLSKE